MKEYRELLPHNFQQIGTRYWHEGFLKNFTFIFNCRSLIRIASNCRAETRRTSACAAAIRCCRSGISSNPGGARSLFSKRIGSDAWTTQWDDEKYCGSSSVTFGRQPWGQFVMIATILLILSLLHGTWPVFNMVISSGLHTWFLVIVLAVDLLTS